MSKNKIATLLIFLYVVTTIPVFIWGSHIFVIISAILGLYSIYYIWKNREQI